MEETMLKTLESWTRGAMWLAVEVLRFLVGPVMIEERRPVRIPISSGRR